MGNERNKAPTDTTLGGASLQNVQTLLDRGRGRRGKKPVPSLGLQSGPSTGSVCGARAAERENHADSSTAGDGTQGQVEKDEPAARLNMPTEHAIPASEEEEEEGGWEWEAEEGAEEGSIEWLDEELGEDDWEDTAEHLQEDQGVPEVIELSSGDSAGDEKDVGGVKRKGTAIPPKAVRQARLLCLLGRGRLMDAAADDLLVQATVLSLVPQSCAEKIRTQQLPSSAVDTKALMHFTQWFHNSYTAVSLASRGTNSSGDRDVDGSDPIVRVREELTEAALSRQGTVEALCALSAAMLRSLGCTVRIVSLLDSVPPATRRALSKRPSYPARGTARLARDMPSNGPGKAPAAKGASSGPGMAKTGTRRKRKASMEDSVPSAKSVRGKAVGKAAEHKGASGKQDLSLSITAVKVEDDDAKASSMGALSAPSKKKRKGDIEIERQLEMAMMATALHVPSSGGDGGKPQSEGGSKAGNAGLGGRWRRRSQGGDHGSAGMLTWSPSEAQLGAGMHWLEVFCKPSGASTSEARGRWVHVDCVLAKVEQPEQVTEILGKRAGRPTCALLFAVAFRGSGAKDVTAKYTDAAAGTRKPAGQHSEESWWEETLCPLRRIEADARMGGSCPGGPGADTSQPEKQPAPGRGGCGPAPLAPGAVDGVLAGNTTLQTRRSQGLVSGELAGAASGSSALQLAEEEDREIRGKVEAAKCRLPTSMEGFKNHPLYVLGRHIGRYQGLVPGTKLVGLHKGEPYYPRKALSELHTADRWRREGRVVREDELEKPAKVEKKRKQAAAAAAGARGRGSWRAPGRAFGGRGGASGHHQDRRNASVTNAEDAGDSGGASPSSPAGQQTILFGIWQTEELQLRPAEGGKVPKDEKGRIECPPFAARLPPGTVHLPMRNLVTVCKRLGVDFAYAMVGFEIRSGRPVPKTEGVVVCEEHAEAVAAAHQEAVVMAERKARRKERDECDKAWRVLLQAVWQRVRLEDENRRDSPACSVAVTKALEGGGAAASKLNNHSVKPESCGEGGEAGLDAIAKRLQEEALQDHFQGCDADFEEI